MEIYCHLTVKVQPSAPWQLLFASSSVAAEELINTAGSVHKSSLASVEGVRRAGDFHLNKGIGLTFELNSLFCLACGAGEEHITVAHVLEYHRTIVGRMDVFFHFYNIFTVLSV